jgi:hypothetical protein
VTDLATLIEILACTALVVAPVVVLTRLVAGDDGPGLPAIPGSPLEAPWPRGVQEEEPLPWRLDRLSFDHPPPSPDRATAVPSVWPVQAYRARKHRLSCDRPRRESALGDRHRPGAHAGRASSIPRVPPYIDGV